jgi:hypothetical protein
VPEELRHHIAVSIKVAISGVLKNQVPSQGLESRPEFRENRYMPTDKTTSTEILADLKEVARQVMSGGVRDPELLRRVQERAERARKEVLNKFGVQEIGVDTIREMRDAQ